MNIIIQIFCSIVSCEHYKPLIPEWFGQPTMSDFIQVHFFVKNNPDNITGINDITRYEINLNNSVNIPMDSNYPLEILLHGWGGDGNLEWINTLKDTLLENGSRNVMIIDWESLALTFYSTAIQNIPLTAEYIAKILVSLILTKKLNHEDIRIRGFSLGAHVAGFIGKIIYAHTGKKIGRITGLDPAGMFIENLPIDKRLDKEDAMFVDVIHSCGSLIGLMKDVGHADFYPNGGASQACFYTTPCGSWKNFTQGICDNKKRLSMGYHVDTKLARGKYYLYVNPSSPFARG